jgi:hypothetical protein
VCGNHEKNLGPCSTGRKTRLTVLFIRGTNRPWVRLMSTKTYTAELLWKWQDSLEDELRTGLMAAVQRTWPYAQLSAWSYLHDESLSVDIMEQSLESIYSYALRSSPRPSAEKLTARLRSQVRRVTKQMANRRRKEEAVGSTHDLELNCSSTETPDPTDVMLIQEVLDLLSPQAREVAVWLWMGYSWREIGKTFEVDHNSIRLAFRREADAALERLGRGMRIAR